jgi:hypothetical protein
MNFTSPEQRLANIESFINQNYNNINNSQNMQNGMNILLQKIQQLELQINNLSTKVTTIENTLQYTRKKYNLQ